MSLQTVSLERFTDDISPHDPNANFKRDVASYTSIDPMPTIEGMSRNLGLPISVIVRYVLVKWATSGSEGVMEIGPRVVRQMSDIVEEAERNGHDSDRFQAYTKLVQIISWLNKV